MADKLKILFVQHELYKWQRAKMWGYTWHLGLEEGLRANDVDLFTLMTPWIPRAKELCAGRKFDQVWINDITHSFEPGGCGGYQLQEKDFEWLASLAPVRLGFIMESLEYTPVEHRGNPALAYARYSLEKTGKYMTHIMTPDEKDLPLIRSLHSVPVSWFIMPIPERFIRKDITLAPQMKPIFRGTPYGERARWLEIPELKNLINQAPSADNFTALPRFFDELQILAQNTISSASFELSLYDQYLLALRKIRSHSFMLYMNSMSEGCAVVCLPSFGKIYTGTTYEGMASGRPVITARIGDRPMLESEFEDGRDFLLYLKDDPMALVEHIQYVLRDPEFGQQIATNARDKLLTYHTTEKRVNQFLHWVATGQESRYCNVKTIRDDVASDGNKDWSVDTAPVTVTGETFYDWPTVIDIEILTVCNLHCSNCYQQHIHRKRKPSMPLADFERLLDRLDPLLARAQEISFGSVEALLHRDFLTMIRRIRSRHTRPAIPIYTNGMLLTVDRIRPFLEHNVNTFIISLDGSRKSTVEAFKTGVDFDRVINNIRQVKKAFAGRLHLWTNFVANRSNINELNEYVDLCFGLGIEQILISGFIAYDAAVVDQCLYSETGLPEIDELFQQAAQRAAQSGIMLHHHTTRLRRGICHVTRAMHVDIEGNLVPCNFLGEQIQTVLGNTVNMPERIVWGNVFLDDPVSLWNGKAGHTFRQDVQRGHLPPVCGRCPIGHAVICG
jgi:MoaA/NifB/PqqE/SkfB family radical SAM enzyme